LLPAQRIECVNAAPDRQVHVLTRQLGKQKGTLTMSVRVGRVGGGKLAGNGSFGFRLGVLGTLKEYPEPHDYRNNLWPATGEGFNAGVAGDGGK
jgi:alkaline phosphatase D